MQLFSAQVVYALASQFYWSCTSFLHNFFCYEFRHTWELRLGYRVRVRVRLGVRVEFVMLMWTYTTMLNMVIEFGTAVTRFAQVSCTGFLVVFQLKCQHNHMIYCSFVMHCDAVCSRHWCPHFEQHHDGWWWVFCVININTIIIIIRLCWCFPAGYIG